MKLEKIVADNIRGFRKLQKLTQEALAIKSHLHPNYISRFERGEVGMSLSSLEQIVKTLRI